MLPFGGVDPMLAYTLLFGGGYGYDDEDGFGMRRGHGHRDRSQWRGKTEGSSLITGDDLRALCKAHGLPVSGTNKVLLERLLKARNSGVDIIGGASTAAIFARFFGVAPLVPGQENELHPDPGFHDNSPAQGWQEKHQLPAALKDNMSRIFDLINNIEKAPFAYKAETPKMNKFSIDFTPKSGAAAFSVDFPLYKEMFWSSMRERKIDPNYKTLWEGASAAPFGKGTETLFDSSVRNCRQYEASEFKINDESFNKLFSNSKDSTFMESIRTSLSPSYPAIEARLYKLVVYQPGSFFAEHVDTQRSEDMFGTVVVELSPEFSGGDLVLRHPKTNETDTMDNHASMDNKGSYSVIAFYADVKHEVKKVESGYRLALIFNLHRLEGPATPPEPLPASAELAAHFTNALKAIQDKPEDKDDYELDSHGQEIQPPCVIGLLLLHQYAVTTCTPQNLKGPDALIYQAINASPELEAAVFPVHLERIGVGGSDDPGDIAYAEDEICEDDPECFPVMSSTYVLDPLQSSKMGFKVLSNQSLEDCGVRFMSYPMSHMKQVYAKMHPSGNEGTSVALLYAHGAIFIKLKSLDRTPKNFKLADYITPVDPNAPQPAKKKTPKKAAVKKASVDSDDEDAAAPSTSSAPATGKQTAKPVRAKKATVPTPVAAEEATPQRRIARAAAKRAAAIIQLDSDDDYDDDYDESSKKKRRNGSDDEFEPSKKSKLGDDSD